FFQAADGIRDFHVTGVDVCSSDLGIKLDRDWLEIRYPGLPATRKAAAEINLREEVSAFRGAFADNGGDEFNFISNGLFGFFTFEIGRASCRERVEVWVVAVSVAKM